MDGMTINHIVSIDHGSCGETPGCLAILIGKNDGHHGSVAPFWGTENLGKPGKILAMSGSTV